MLGRGVLETADAIAVFSGIEMFKSSETGNPGIKRIAANAAAPSGTIALMGNLKVYYFCGSRSLHIIFDLRRSSNCAHSSSVGRSHLLSLSRSSSVGFLSGIISLYSLLVELVAAAWRNASGFLLWRGWSQLSRRFPGGLIPRFRKELLPFYVL